MLYYILAALCIANFQKVVKITFKIFHYLTLSPKEYLHESSVTRLGDLLHFGQLFKACGNNYLPNSPTFYGIFLKVSKTFIFF